ncbi:hypothetical protein [Paraliobacillus zengyii]|uniref:hypothetical protein n=1 Tax=Paraliobacillus zengyii TaxID=2213194 RepID=UPI000E3E3821|nr:hypothetical protein [Paraliobacillus zengyii]
MKKKTTTDKQKQTGENIEVWADLVNIKDLVVALVITSVTTLGAYFIAPNEDPKPLFFGLIGALIGFVISSFLIKPKRNFDEAESEEE